MNLLWVFLGGGVGSLVRYGLSVLFQRQQMITLPYATLLANVISCLIFGIIYFIYQQKEAVPGSLRLLVLVGFCGGLSTFSTFSYETFELIKRGDNLYAALNVIVSVSFCLAIFYLFANKAT